MPIPTGCIEAIRTIGSPADAFVLEDFEPELAADLVDGDRGAATRTRCTSALPSPASGIAELMTAITTFLPVAARD